MNKRQLESFYPLTLVVRRLFHKLGHGVAALHQDSDISAGMRAVLESVIDAGPRTVPQMARVRPVTRQHIQGLVNALLDGGYVEYTRNPAHKRSKLVSPTGRGVRMFRAMRTREIEALRQVQLQATPEELETATKALRALITTFDGPEWQSIAAQYTPESEE